MGVGDSNGVPRAPRIGVEVERIEAAGIDYVASSCHLTRDKVETPAGVISIINISVGGVKIVIGAPVRDPRMDDHVVVKLAHSAGVWTLKGRAAWVQLMTADQWWLGIELDVTADALQAFRLLVGEDES